jgi:glycosyltransferase involved in cell wall biosynthesis
LNTILDIVNKSWDGPILATSWGFDLLDPKMISNNLNFEKFHGNHPKFHALIVDTLIGKKKSIEIGVPESIIYLLPWGVEEDFWNTEDKDNKFQDLSLTNPIYLSTRRHEQIYNIDLVINEFLSASIPNSTLLVAGEGFRTSYLRSIKKSSFGNVKFIGHLSREDLKRVYSKSHFYITASSVDGSSVSLLEAMTMRCLVIASRIPGNLEWISQNSGIIFDLNENSLRGALNESKTFDFVSDILPRLDYATSQVSKKAKWSDNSKILGIIFKQLVN